MERIGCAHRFAAPAAVGQTLLGKRPRYAPDRDFDTVHVSLDLAVDLKGRSLSGSAASTVKVLARKIKHFSFQAAGMKVSAAFVDGKKTPFKLKDGRLNVTAGKNFSAGDEAVVEVRYRLDKPNCGVHFTGPGPETPNSPVQMWTQGQPEDVHFWFPCHDHPQEKATTEITARVPKGFVAVSNGVLLSRRSESNREVFHWRMHHPHSLYLVTLAVGRFAEVKKKWEDVDILYYCEKGREADAERGFRATIPSMEIFSKTFGVRYPYEKYAQVAAAEFPGGMENTTATTQTDACLLTRDAALDTDLDLLVSHELAHQWFGDLLTCREWSHAWLNEGFATYGEMVFTEQHKGADERDYEMERNRQSYIDEDAHRYRRAIVHQNYRYPWVLFDRHLYEKGGWVVHMLRRTLGEEDFWKAIRHYLIKNRNKSVETTDLILAVEEATGKNMRWFFDQWVYRPGHPELKVSWTWQAKSGKAEVRVEQAQAKSGEAFRLPLEFRFSGKRGKWKREFTETVKKAEHTFTFALPEAPAMFEVDPEHSILKTLDLKKEHSLWLEELRWAKTGRSRARAAWHVAGWGDSGAVTALADCVRKDSFWGTSAEAAKALGSIKTQAALKELLGLLKIRHPKIRRAVVEALAGFDDPAAARAVTPLITRDASLHVRAQAARNLGRLRDPKAIGLLKKAMAHKGYWDIAAAGALQGLASTRDLRVLPILRKASKAPTNYPLRAHAIRALGGFYSSAPGVLEDLIAALSSKDERILLPAVQTLGGLGDRKAVEPLRKLKKESSDTRIKVYADESLARILGEAEGKD